MGFTITQWEFQDPKLEVPTMYKAHFSGLCKGISQQNMILYFRILKFPLINWGYPNMDGLYMENPMNIIKMDGLGVPLF